MCLDPKCSWKIPPAKFDMFGDGPDQAEQDRMARLSAFARDGEAEPKMRKVPVGLFPPVAIIYGAEVMAAGNVKHGGSYNWRETGVNHMEYLEKAMRHILAAMDGELLDPEDGRPHEAHALCDLAIILDCIEENKLLGDTNHGQAAELMAAFADDREYVGQNVLDGD